VSIDIESARLALRRTVVLALALSGPIAASPPTPAASPASHPPGGTRAAETASSSASTPSRIASPSSGPAHPSRSSPPRRDRSRSPLRPTSTDASRAADVDCNATAISTGEAVRRAVLAQLDRLAEGIRSHEAERPRDLLLARRMTVETFLLAGLVPQQLVFGEAPDVAAPWRTTFDGPPAPLETVVPRSATTREDDASEPLRPLSFESGTFAGLAGRFTVVLQRPVAGDDAVAISGRFLVRPERVLLAATWCEPCMSTHAVDFPILPEAFLLEWDDDWRRLRVRHPVVDEHAEPVADLDDAPPRLDQPGDLFDLFDGLRGLPWLLRRPPHDRDARAGPASPPVDRQASSRAADPGPTDADTGPSAWIARDARGRVLQRVRLVRLDGDGARLEVEQPPIEVRWRAAERYELVGDVLGEPVPPRSIRPEGRIVAHEGGTSMILEIDVAGAVDPPRSASSRPGPSARATILADGRPFATLRWSRSRTCSTLEADRLEARLRHAFGPRTRSDATSNVDGFVRIDPAAAARRDLRGEVRNAILNGAIGVVEDRMPAHLDRLAADGLPPTTALRSIEALEERLLGGEIGRVSQRVLDALDRAWRLAMERCDAATIDRFVVERIRQGRLGAAARAAAWRLSTFSEDAGSSLSAIAERLATLAADGARPRAPWFEPPGRIRLDHRILGLSDVATANSNQASLPSSGTRSVERRRDGEPNPISTALAASLVEALDEVVESTGIEPRGDARDRLVEAITEVVDRGERRRLVRDRWSDPTDRARLKTAFALHCSDRRSSLVEHLRHGASTVETSASPSPFESSLRECLERVVELGPARETTRRAGDREESGLLQLSLATAADLVAAHRISTAGGDELRDALVAISDARRVRRASPCFPDLMDPIAPSIFSNPLGSTTPNAIEAVVGADSMLAAIAARIAIEESLIASDPDTAPFRTAMRSAQIEALAVRIDGLVLEALFDDVADVGADSRSDAAPDGDDGDMARSRPVASGPNRSADGSHGRVSASNSVAPTSTSSMDRRRHSELLRWLIDGTTAPAPSRTPNPESRPTPGDRRLRAPRRSASRRPRSTPRDTRTESTPLAIAVANAGPADRDRSHSSDRPAHVSPRRPENGNARPACGRDLAATTRIASRRPRRSDRCDVASPSTLGE